MNKIQQYDYIRSLDESQYAFVKDMFKRCKTATIESVNRAVEIILGVGLAYVAYDAIDVLPQVIAGIGALHFLFNRSIKALIGSIFGAFSYNKSGMDVAKDAAINLNNMIADVNIRKFCELADKVNKEDPNDK